MSDLTSLARATIASKIVVVGGAGGVGKTTTAAALAYQAARECEAKVLVITIDPARRLASALGAGELSHAPVALTIPSDAKGQLYASMVDMKLAWDEMIHRCAPNRGLAERIMANPMYQSISSRFVQSHNYIAVEVLFDLYSQGDFDLIVVDTPPSRRAMDFLEAPGRMDEFFSSKLLRWLTVSGRSRVLSSAFRPFYLVAERILGSSALRDLSEFFLDFQQLYGGFVSRAQEVATLLKSEAATFVVVTIPEVGPTSEARTFLGELVTRGYHIGGVVMNRSLPDDIFSNDAAVLARSLIGHSAESSQRFIDAYDGPPMEVDQGAESSQLNSHIQVLGRVFVEMANSYEVLAMMKEMEALQTRRLGVDQAVIIAAPQLYGDITSLERLGDLGSTLWHSFEHLR